MVLTDERKGAESFTKRSRWSYFSSDFCQVFLVQSVENISYVWEIKYIPYVMIATRALS